MPKNGTTASHRTPVIVQASRASLQCFAALANPRTAFRRCQADFATSRHAPASTRSKGVDAQKSAARNAGAAFAKVAQREISHRCRERGRIGVVLVEQRPLQIVEKTGESEVDLG